MGHQQSRSRSLLLLSVNTLYGLVDLFLLLYQPSKLCGSPKRNMMNLAQELFTGSASNFILIFIGEKEKESNILVLYKIINIIGKTEHICIMSIFYKLFCRTTSNFIILFS